MNVMKGEKRMKKRTSRIIAMMLVLVMVICNQSYSSWASDRNDIVSEGAEIASDESGAEQSGIATDSDAWQEADN